MGNLTAAQRRKLPPSAFVYPTSRKYPVPTATQARKAGISESARLKMHNSALSLSESKRTAGSQGRVAKVVSNRSTARQRASVQRSAAPRRGSAR